MFFDFATFLNFFNFIIKKRQKVLTRADVTNQFNSFAQSKVTLILLDEGPSN